MKPPHLKALVRTDSCPEIIQTSFAFRLSSGVWLLSTWRTGGCTREGHDCLGVSYRSTTSIVSSLYFPAPIISCAVCHSAITPVISKLIDQANFIVCKNVSGRYVWITINHILTPFFDLNCFRRIFLYARKTTRQLSLRSCAIGYSSGIRFFWCNFYRPIEKFRCTIFTRPEQRQDFSSCITSLWLFK